MILYTRSTGERYIILKGSVDVAELLCQFCREDDDRKLFETPVESPLSVDLVHRVMDSMNDEYDRSVAKMLLCVDKSRAQTYQLGIKPDRATKMLKTLEERLAAWENTKIAAEDLVNRRLTERIESFEKRVKEVEKKIEVSTTWTPERIGDLHEQQLMLQESLENVRKLMVNHFFTFFWFFK